MEQNPVNADFNELELKAMADQVKEKQEAVNTQKVLVVDETDSAIRDNFARAYGQQAVEVVEDPQVQIGLKALEYLDKSERDFKYAKASDEELEAKGLIRLKNGQILKRSQVCYSLHASEKDPSLLIGIDQTIYHKDNKGTLRRVTPKITKHSRNKKK